MEKVFWNQSGRVAVEGGDGQGGTGDRPHGALEVVLRLDFSFRTNLGSCKEIKQC